jgi:hypothetical protein
VNSEAAPPATSSLRRLHRRPVVSTVVFPSLAPYLLLALPVRVPSCHRTLVALSFFQEWAATRVALEAPPRRGHPRHAASAVMERVPSCRVCCWRDRGLPPRRAVVLCTERASRLKSGVLAVAPSWFAR